MFNYLSSSYDSSFIWVIVFLLVIIFILRGLLRYYVSSKIMCILFSITTIVLAIVARVKENIGDVGPWIFYTTFSTYMYSYGPEVFVTGFKDRLVYHEGFGNAFVTVEKQRTGGILVYIALGLALTFTVVNVIGYQSGMYFFFMIIPIICIITSTVGLIRYFK